MSYRNHRLAESVLHRASDNRLIAVFGNFNGAYCCEMRNRQPNALLDICSCQEGINNAVRFTDSNKEWISFLIYRFF